jgi:hypothetical protein
MGSITQISYPFIFTVLQIRHLPYVKVWSVLIHFLMSAVFKHPVLKNTVWCYFIVGPVFIPMRVPLSSNVVSKFCSQKAKLFSRHCSHRGPCPANCSANRLVRHDFKVEEG